MDNSEAGGSDQESNGSYVSAPVGIVDGEEDQGVEETLPVQVLTNRMEEVQKGG